MKKLAYTFILLTAMMGTSVVTMATLPPTTEKTQEVSTAKSDKTTEASKETTTKNKKTSLRL